MLDLYTISRCVLIFGKDWLVHHLIIPGKSRWRRYTGHASPSLKTTMPGAARGGSWRLLGGFLLILLSNRKKGWLFVAALDFFVFYSISMILLYINHYLRRSVYLFHQPSYGKTAAKRSWRGFKPVPGSGVAILSTDYGDWKGEWYRDPIYFSPSSTYPVVV